MSDKIFLKDITLPIIETGENETYSFVQTDSDLETAGDAADAKKTGDEITQLKADLTAVETDIETGNLTAGTSEQLLSDNGMTDKAPYLFRAMPTNADREEPVIVGGSVVWNQISKISSRAWPSGGYNGITVTKVDDATLHVSGTATANAQARAYYNATILVTRQGHVFYAKSGDSRIGIGIGNGYADYAEIITKPNAISESSVIFKIMSGADFGENGIDVKPQIYDLTAMFGSAIADYIAALSTLPERIAYLKKYGFFTEDYYPYTEPTFKHVEGLTAHKMVGFNQLDVTNIEKETSPNYNINVGETLATGTNADVTISGENPVNITNTTNWRGAVFFSDVLVSGMQYKCEHRVTGSTLANIKRSAYLVDENKKVVTKISISSSVDHDVNHVYGFTFTPDAEGLRLAFSFDSSSAQTIKVYDICCHLELDGERDGEYEPYKEYTYPLDSDVVLRGIPKLDASNNLYFDGDVYEPSGKISRRWGIITFDGSADEQWGYYTITSSDNANNLFRIDVADRKSGNIALSSNDVKVIANNFAIAKNTTTGRTNMTISGSNTNMDFVIASCSSGEEWLAYLSSNPITVVYPLATPTTETADPFTPLQFADPYGTEEWVLDADAFPMPVGQETFYPENLRAKIEGLPWNFANLIAPTETTYTATRAYTAGQLFIVDNILYQATTSIASGGTITPGTNCTATTLAEVISALQ